MKHPVDSLAFMAMCWVTGGRTHQATSLRTKAAAFCLCPAVFDGKTMAEIARAEGVTKQAFQKVAGHFRDLVGIGYIRTDKERLSMKRAALKSHRERKGKA